MATPTSPSSSSPNLPPKPPTKTILRTNTSNGNGSEFHFSSKSNSSLVTKAEFEAQLAALRADVQELSDTVDGSSSFKDSVRNPSSVKVVNSIYQNTANNTINKPPSLKLKPSQTTQAQNQFNFPLNENTSSNTTLDLDSIHTSMGGASTLLGQLARTQRDLKEMKIQRDELINERSASAAAANGYIPPPPMPRSPQSLENEVIKMRQMIKSMERDHEITRLALENSEMLRVTQVELIAILQGVGLEGFEGEGAFGGKRGVDEEEGDRVQSHLQPRPLSSNGDGRRRQSDGGGALSNLRRGSSKERRVPEENVRRGSSIEMRRLGDGGGSSDARRGSSIERRRQSESGGVAQLNSSANGHALHGRRGSSNERRVPSSRFEPSAAAPSSSMAASRKTSSTCARDEDQFQNFVSADVLISSDNDKDYFGDGGRQRTIKSNSSKANGGDDVYGNKRDSILLRRKTKDDGAAGVLKERRSSFANRGRGGDNVQMQRDGRERRSSSAIGGRKPMTY